MLDYSRARDNDITKHPNQTGITHNPVPNNLSQMREPKDDTAKGHEEIAKVDAEVPHGLFGFRKLAHHATTTFHGTQTTTSSSGIAPPLHPGKCPSLLSLDDATELSLNVLSKDTFHIL